MWMGTFHSMFARLLRREADRIGFTSDFSIYDTDDTDRVLRSLMTQYNVDPKQFSTNSIRSLISSAKNSLVSPAEYARLAASPPQEKAALLYGPYVELLKRSNALDFDDLLIKPIELFQRFGQRSIGLGQTLFGLRLGLVEHRVERRVEQRGNVAAMHRADRVVVLFARLPGEGDATLFDLDRTLISGSPAPVFERHLRNAGVEPEGGLPLFAPLDRWYEQVGETPLSALADIDTPTLAAAKIDVDDISFGAVVRALATNSNANLLSTPSLLTLDNQEALIEVGQEVPFIQGEFTTPVTSGGVGGANGMVNPFRTLERKSIGLKLKVTPQINEGDAVVLTLEQEISSLAPNVQGAVDLITNQRILKTTVLVGDGQLLVLGGLVTEDQNERVNRVPGLGNIPVLGNLFKHRSSTRVRRNLMIFLRPVILRDAAVESAISGSKYNYIRGEQLRMRDQGDGLLAPEQRPVLPTLESIPPPGSAEAMPMPTPEPATERRRGRRR